jgi:hypothetical protein
LKLESGENKQLKTKVEEMKKSIDRLQEENLDLKYYVEKEKKETSGRANSIVEKGRRLLEKGTRSNNMNIISKNF